MPATAAPASSAVPIFALYGESTWKNDAETVHVELIETRSRKYDWHIAAHAHTGLFQVLFLFRGHVRANLGGARRDCTGPVALTIHPSLPHGFDFSEEAQGYVLTVDQDMLFAAAGHDGDLFAPLFVQPLAIGLDASSASCARIEALLQDLVAECAWPRHGHALMLEWLARSALLMLVRLHAEQRIADSSGPGDFALFSRFRVEIERHYKEQWLVGRYAAALRVTPARLNRLCLKLSGKSAFEMTQDRLMLEACRQLTYLPATVASIAYELGFQDPAYFSRLFKKLVGMTPKAFRHKAQGRDGMPA